MRRIAFFVPAEARSTAAPNAGNDNHERLPNAYRAAGWQVARFDRDRVAVQAGRLVADTLSGDRRPLAGFDRYFVLGFGAEASFLDRMQMLRALLQQRFVNAVDALVYQHGKVSLALACPDVPQPQSHLSNDPAHLHELLAEGGEWVVKPPAGSFGRGVFRLSRGDANGRAILEQLTRGGRYALLQEHVGEGAEKRVLIAGSEVIGAYGKTPLDHRGNLEAGATATLARLAAAERATVARLVPALGRLGIGFATADLVNAKVLEVNVANPGWLRTHERLTGEDLAPRVVAALESNAARLDPPRADGEAAALQQRGGGSG